VATRVRRRAGVRKAWVAERLGMRGEASGTVARVRELNAWTFAARGSPGSRAPILVRRGLSHPDAGKRDGVTSLQILRLLLKSEASDRESGVMPTSAATMRPSSISSLVRPLLRATALLALVASAQAQLTYFDADITGYEVTDRSSTSVGQVMAADAYSAEEVLGNPPAHDYQLLVPLLDCMISDVFRVLSSGSGNGSDGVDIEDYDSWETNFGADINTDGAVDARDFALWRDHLGSVVTPPAPSKGDGRVDSVDYGTWRETSEDFNADGLVDAVDYLAWRDTSSALPSDDNGDGLVDAGDHVIWAVDDGDFSIWQSQFGSEAECSARTSRDGSAEWGFCAGIPETLLVELEAVRTTGGSRILSRDAVEWTRDPAVNDALLRLLLLCLVDTAGGDSRK